MDRTGKDRKQVDRRGAESERIGMDRIGTQGCGSKRIVVERGSQIIKWIGTDRIRADRIESEVNVPKGNTWDRKGEVYLIINRKGQDPNGMDWSLGHGI